MCARARHRQAKPKRTPGKKKKTPKKKKGKGGWEEHALYARIFETGMIRTLNPSGRHVLVRMLKVRPGARVSLECVWSDVNDGGVCAFVGYRSPTAAVFCATCGCVERGGVHGEHGRDLQLQGS